VKQQRGRVIEGRIITIALAAAFALLTAIPALAQTFTPGNLIVTVEGNGVEGASSGPYTDNQAAPLTLFQFSINGTTSATYVNSYVLPQTASGANSPVSGEYGSSSEGTLQLSGDGKYLTVMGYGVNASDFNMDPGSFSVSPSNTALGQSGSMTGQTYTAVPRVVALIDANGDLDSTTALYNIFNANNPRSIYTADDTNLYVSGQGNSPDATGGVFFTTLGSSSATAITGLDTSSNTSSQDTRDVQINFNTLYISVDSKEGSGAARDFIGTLGSPPSTSLYNSGGGPTMIPGFGNSGGTGKVTITSGANGNGNGLNAGKQINLSPNNYFFANSTTLYVADSGAPKNNSASSSLGDGGLQKWSLVSGSWVLDYTLAAGLNLVANTNTDGTSGLYGLTGVVNGTQVQLYATNYTLADLDQTYLYGITDTLSDTTASQAAGESFTQLAIAPADSNFKGVAFAPNAVSTPTATATSTATPTATATATATTTATATATDTATATATATDTATATATDTATNTGTATATATATDTATATATATNTATATATATPTATATATATDTATATATNTATATATPTATPTTSMSVTASLAFANTAVGQTSTKTTVTVTNTGRTNPLTVSAATPSDPEYALSGTGTCGPLPITLAHGTHCTLGISFSPSAVGPHPATLMLFDNATSSPQQVTLSGTGIAGLTTTKSSLVYGDVKFGAEGIEAFSVVNHQTQPVSLSESFGGTNPSDFSVTGGTCTTTLAADKACSIIVSFSPSVLGTESATISVADSPDPLSPYTVALSTGPTIPETIAPVTLAYGTLTARTPTKTKDVTITNKSGFPLSVGESFSGPNETDFTVTGGTCGGTAPANSTCTIAVTFTPTAGGSSESASMAVTVSNDPTSPHNITLTGTGP
jgi:hypothetical protein